MARKPLKKDKNTAIADNLVADFNFYNAGFGIVDSKGKVSSQNIHKFLINPESIEDNKSINWASHNIPGQESPVYQWTGGGPRVVSFEALVTKDTIYLETKPQDNSLLNTALNVVGSIASSFLGVQLPPLSALGTNVSTPGNELSIENELEVYRSLYRPKYTQDAKLESSPPLIVLYLGSSLGMEPLPDPKVANSEITKFALLWMLTSLNIKITKWLPNLSPMEALVSFQFTQYQITSLRQGGVG